MRAIRVPRVWKAGCNGLKLAETARDELMSRMARDLRQCDALRDRQTLAEPLRSGFEFPWGHHDQR